MTRASSTPSSRRVRRPCTTATAWRSSPTAQQFYPAMLEAIRGATRSINMELYIFQPGDDRRPVRRRRCRNARATASTSRSSSMRSAASASAAGPSGVEKAGCRIEHYQRLRWYIAGARSTTARTASCSIVDGRIAFAGGAGIADWWALPRQRRRKTPAWRDTMARIEGPVVAALQGVAAENWLECCGEILTGPEYFPDLDEGRRHDGVRRAELARGPRDRFRASRSSCSSKAPIATCEFQTPYFLPDRALRRALVGLAQRGVDVSVIVPGRGDRSAMGSLGQPADVGRAARGRRPHPRISRDDDACQGAARRSATGRCSARRTWTIARSSTTTKSTSRCATRSSRGG